MIFKRHILGIYDQERKNNLDLIRLVAALIVIYSHSFLILGKFEQEPLHRLTGFLNLGSIGVYIFFTISGYLITKSFIKQQDPTKYVVARSLRIFPGLIICTVFTVFIIGPIFTQETLKSYFLNIETFNFLATVPILHNWDVSLPGLFKSNPYPSSVNSPLWTLRAELIMYVVVLIACCLYYYFFEKKKISYKNLLLIIAVLLFCVTMYLPFEYLKAASQWSIFFCAGSLLYISRNRIFLSIPLSIVLLMASLISILLTIPFHKALFSLALIYFIFVFAYHPKLQTFNISKLGDFSYGLYIYAFPLQQCVAMYYPNMSAEVNFIISVILTTPLAIMSWFFIEKPSLAYKEKFRKNRCADSDLIASVKR